MKEKGILGIKEWSLISCREGMYASQGALALIQCPGWLLPSRHKRLTPWFLSKSFSLLFLMGLSRKRHASVGKFTRRQEREVGERKRHQKRIWVVWQAVLCLFLSRLWPLERKRNGQTTINEKSKIRKEPKKNKKRWRLGDNARALSSSYLFSCFSWSFLLGFLHLGSQVYISVSLSC